MKASNQLGLFFALAVTATTLPSDAFGEATLSRNSYQKADDVWDGSITNEAHWSLGHVPKAGEQMYFNSIASDFTLSFPAGGSLVSPANMYLSVKDGYATVVDGRGSRWAISGSDDDSEVHRNYPLQIVGNLELMGLYLGAAAGYTHPAAEMSNFWFAVTSSADSPKLVVDGGFYDFRNPLGSTAFDALASGNQPILYVGNGHAAVTTEVLFRNGATVRAWNFGLQAGAPMNTVTFDGANGYFGTLNMPNGSIDYYNALANRSDLVLTNDATITTTGNVSFGHRANKDVRMLLTGSGTRLEVGGAFTGAAGSRMSVLDLRDGATLDVRVKWTMTNSGGTNYTNIAGGHLAIAGDTAEFGACDSSKRAQQLCRVTATGGSVRYCVTGNALKFDGNTSVWTSNTTWDVWNLYLGNKGNGGRSSFEIHGGSVSVTNEFDVGRVDRANLLLDGGNLTVWKYFHLGGTAGATGVVTVASGTLDNSHTAAETPTATANCMYIANVKGSYGEFNVTGGEAKLNSLFAAWYGHAKVNVSGGRLSVRGELRLGNGRTTDEVYDEFNMTGGEVECMSGSATKIGFASPSRARIRLAGGVFMVNGLEGGNAAEANGGSGRAVLVGDGGTLAAKSACTVLSKFDEVTLDAGGLTIDTQGFNVTIDQNLAGVGVLTLTGGGKVTFAAGKTCGVAVKVTGGTVVDFNGVSPAGLVLGDENGKGILAVTVGSTVAVAGDIVLNEFSLSVTGSMAMNTDYAPFLTCTGAFDAASQEKWADMVLGASVSPDYSEVYSWSESGGVTSLTAKKTDKVVHLIEVKEGTSNITWDVSFRPTENTEVAVSNGAVCAISGDVAKGGLVKTGVGRLDLSGANTLLGGFGFSEGLVRILSADAVGMPTDAMESTFGSGTLEVPALAGSVRFAGKSALSPDPATNATIFKTEGDLTMPLPCGDGAGAVFKRGAGRLTFTCDDVTSRSGKWSEGNPPDTLSRYYAFPKNPTPVVFDDVQGIPPADARYGLINIVEGELALRCAGTRKRVDFTVAPTYVGYPAADRSAQEVQPALVLDNVECRFGGTHLHVGDSYSGVNPWVVEPKVVVTNNAVLSVNTLILTDTNADNEDCSPLLYVNGGTVDATYRFQPHYSNNSKVVPRGVFVNSTLYTPQTELRKPDMMWFTNSLVAYNSSGVYTGSQVVKATKMLVCDETASHEWHFAAGSRLWLELLGLNNVAATKQVKFTFDDSEWIPGSSTLAFSEICEAGAVDMISEGVGFVLAPPEGVTWTFDLALRGDGGFVKRGDGTVVFGGAYAGHAGRTVAEAGVLDLGGTTWAGRTFGGGAGTISNGAISSATISLDVVDDGESWTAASTPLFSGCTFSGRVRVNLGRTAENPLSAASGAGPQRSLVVARYSGAAPDVSAWRLTGTGIRGVGGVFVAEGGEIRATAQTVGSIIFVK